jgi:hypothetical protein
MYQNCEVLFQKESCFFFNVFTRLVCNERDMAQDNKEE